MLKAAVIGMGMMGKRHHRLLSRMPGIGLGAVCDTRPISGVPQRIYSSVDSLLAREALDFAVIATPASRHENTAIRCMKHGVNLLIEKPVASTLQAGNNILRAANDSRVKVAVGHVERFNPVVSALVEELEHAEIYTIHITRVGPFPQRVSDVGVLRDLCVHDIDLVRRLSGREISDAHLFKSLKVSRKHEDCVAISLLLDNDVLAQITTNWLSPFRKRMIEVSAKDAYYEADLLSQTLSIYHRNPNDASCASRRTDIIAGDPLGLQLEAFAAYMATGCPAGLATVEDSLATLELLEKLAPGLE